MLIGGRNAGRGSHPDPRGDALSPGWTETRALTRYKQIAFQPWS